MIFSCMDIIYFSHVHPLPISCSPTPATLLPVPSSPSLSCLCARVCWCLCDLLSVIRLRNNFMTYSTQLNFKYILNNKFKFIQYFHLTVQTDKLINIYPFKIINHVARIIFNSMCKFNSLIRVLVCKKHTFTMLIVWHLTGIAHLSFNFA